MTEEECIQHYERTGDSNFQTEYHGNLFIIKYDYLIEAFRLNFAGGNIIPPAAWDRWERW